MIEQGESDTREENLNSVKSVVYEVVPQAFYDPSIELIVQIQQSQEEDFSQVLDGS